ncbi:MAG: sulfatase-like hydrolase/transferase [Byssovorax sp.]
MSKPLESRARRGLRGLALGAFAAQFLILDLGFRGPGAYAFAPRIALDAAASVGLWALLASARGGSAARGVVATIAAAALAIQIVAFRYYHLPVDGQVLASAAHCWSDMRPMATRLLPSMIALVAALALVEYALLAAAPKIRIPRLPAALALLLALALGAPLDDATPDLRLASSLRALWAPASAAAATSVHVPILPSSRAALPSVLFLVTESVRAADYCSGPSPECRVSPEIDRLLPDRVPLRQLRSIASYTAISISALLTGRTQEGTAAEIAAAPNAFDFARAARARGPGPRVAYWSAQLESLFERKDIRSSTDSFVTLPDLIGRPIDDEDSVIDQGVDRLLATRVERELGLDAAPGPLFAMVHFAGTHAPYFVDPADTPFEPWERVVTWAKMPRLLNAYRNAIHTQDRSVARVVRAFLSRQGELPWIIVFTSDHGEAFGEHGAIHHGQSLYDEQIHVPGWIASGNGALTDDERANLRGWENRYATHLDLLPTLLDALGVLDGIAMDPYRRELAGRSLLRPYSPMARAIPISNCTAIFPCALNVWGMLRDDHAVVGQPWDYGFRCVNFATGDDAAPMADACLQLREDSKAFFPTLPNRRPNR